MYEPLAVLGLVQLLTCAASQVPSAKDSFESAKVAAARGDDARVLELCGWLLERPEFRARAARICGPSAVRLCRAGDARGRPALAQIAALWPSSASALANLALADRFLGRYGRSARLYARVAALGGRSAWILNDWGLTLLAKGQREAALALFVEGGRSRTSPAADRHTCRTNAALVLLARGDTGDDARARALLRIVVASGGKRLRAAFWLAEIEDPRGLRPVARRRATEAGLGGRGRRP